jgi:hypothetical protein
MIQLFFLNYLKTFVTALLLLLLLLFFFIISKFLTVIVKILVIFTIAK